MARSASVARGGSVYNSALVSPSYDRRSELSLFARETWEILTNHMIDGNSVGQGSSQREMPPPGPVFGGSGFSAHIRSDKSVAPQIPVARSLSKAQRTPEKGSDSASKGRHNAFGVLDGFSTIKKGKTKMLTSEILMEEPEVETEVDHRQVNEWRQHEEDIEMHDVQEDYHEEWCGKDWRGEVSRVYP